MIDLMQQESGPKDAHREGLGLAPFNTRSLVSPKHDLPGDSAVIVIHVAGSFRVTLVFTRYTRDVIP